MIRVESNLTRLVEALQIDSQGLEGFQRSPRCFLDHPKGHSNVIPVKVAPFCLHNKLIPSSRNLHINPYSRHKSKKHFLIRANDLP